MAAKKSFALTGSTVMLLVGAVAMAGALYWVNYHGPGTQDEAPVVAQDEAAEPAATVAEETDQDAAPAAEVAEVETPQEAPADVATSGPSFDVVRVDHQGVAVIAGDAAPGAEVILRADDTEVARVTADQTGKFVALFDMPPSETPRSLSATMSVNGGEAVASAGTVLIAPVRPIEVVEATPQAEPETVPEIVPETVPEIVPDVIPETEIAEGEEPAEAPEVLAEAEAPADDLADDSVGAGVDEVASSLSPTPEASDSDVAVAGLSSGVASELDVPAAPASPEQQQPASPTIVLADDSGVRVLQGADQPAVPTESPQVDANLVIDTITYNEGGDVALTGRGQGEGFARVYLDDRPVQTVQIAPDGTWRTPLPDVDAGVYRLRIDELDAEGVVTSRVETPFQREEPEIAAAAAGRPNVVTVQEGFTLWAIAEDQFGDGVEFIRVYEANRELIRDPDLIYPGQVFAIPEGADPSEG